MHIFLVVIGWIALAYLWVGLLFTFMLSATNGDFYSRCNLYLSREERREERRYRAFKLALIFGWLPFIIYLSRHERKASQGQLHC